MRLHERDLDAPSTCNEPDVKLKKIYVVATPYTGFRVLYESANPIEWDTDSTLI